jgi:predicted ATP-grasp superfamily ATP-dependent carboligase
VGADLNALGLARSLAAGNMPIVIVGDRGGGPAMDSRHGRKVQVTETSGDALLAALSDIAAHSTAQPVLFLTEEKSVRTVSEHRDRILPGFRIRLPEHERLMALMHKTGFQALADEAGSLLPRALPLQSSADLAVVAQLRFPCVLKPAKKDYAYGARFQKAYVVANIDEVERLFNEIAPVMSDLVVQEWIEGDDSDIHFCLVYMGDGGELVSSFSGRKLRSWPRRIGGTASCISAAGDAAELERLTLEFFRAVGFSGMGSMEYKRDRRDGRFQMVEPTVARTDFQEEVATVNGVNIPLAAYLYESNGERYRPQPAAIPVMWREPVTDKWAREGQTRFPEDGLPHSTCDAYFRTDDPMPWVRLMGGRIRGKFMHMLGK